MCIASSTNALPIDSEKVLLVTYSGGLPLGSILIRYVREIGFVNEYLILSAILALLQLLGASMLLFDFGCHIQNTSIRWELLEKMIFSHFVFRKTTHTKVVMYALVLNLGSTHFGVTS